MVYDFEGLLIYSLSPSPKGRFEPLSEGERAPFARAAHSLEDHFVQVQVQFGRRRKNRNGYAWEGELFRQDHGIKYRSTTIQNVLHD
jgi:hypothetical protein